MFEIRVVVRRDPATGRGVQRSFTVRGDAEHADARRRELVADYGVDLSVLHASGVTVGELLTRWFAAGHAWKPSTRIGYDCDVRALCADPTHQCPSYGCPSRSVTWSVCCAPLPSTSSKPKAVRRRRSCSRPSRPSYWSGWPRTRVRGSGGLAALQVGDLEGRVPHICRNISGPSTVTTPKSHQYRSLTLEQATVDLWRTHAERWPARARGRDWLFAPTPARATFVQPRGLAARFERLREFAGVPDAALHRLRHTVAVMLVAEGKLLVAQHRLGHRDLSTTLRHYGWAQAPGRHRYRRPPRPNLQSRVMLFVRSSSICDDRTCGRGRAS